MSGRDHAKSCLTPAQKVGSAVNALQQQRTEPEPSPQHLSDRSILQRRKIMNGRYISIMCMVAALAVYGTGFGSPSAVAQQVQADVEEGVEVLTRGPVHEAFAVTVT